MKLTVRAYSAADAAALLRVFAASIHTLAAPHYDEAQRRAWAGAEPDLEQWNQRFLAGRTLLAEQDGVIAGFIVYEPDGHIDMLFTDPEFARRGVAALLYDHAERSLAAAGATEIFTEASLVAKPFFEKRGFRVVEEQLAERGGVSLRRFSMRKAL